MKKPSLDRFYSVSEVAKIAKSKILTIKPTSFTENLTEFSEAVEAYAALKALHKVIESRLKVIKPFLHEITSTEMAVDGNLVTKTKRRATVPDIDKLKALLETRGIELTKVFDIVEKLQLNPSRLQFLVDTGKLSAEDVENLHEITWAVEVEPSSDLKSELHGVLQADKSKTERKR